MGDQHCTTCQSFYTDGKTESGGAVYRCKKKMFSQRPEAECHEPKEGGDAVEE